MATLQKPQAAAQKTETRKPPAAAKPTQAGTLPTDEVAARAYEIWQASGRPDGRDQEHWFQAERELQGKQSGATR